MHTRDIQSAVIIGAGNMASQLGMALTGHGVRVAEVFNRSKDAGMTLASNLGARYVANLKELSPDADLYILAVSDAAIALIAAELRVGNKLVVHTSGPTPLSILAGTSVNTGVFYPLQTFSPAGTDGFGGIPVCLEAGTTYGAEQLKRLAEKLTPLVYFIDSDRRRVLHLAAVFACNFSNFMNAVAEDILASQDIPFELLVPLIRQTAENAGRGKVFGLQTGPAVRGDLQVLASHRELLAGDPGYLEIYNLISSNIIKYKSKHGKL